MPRELDSAAAHGGREYATVQIFAEDELGPGGAPHKYILNWANAENHDYDNRAVPFSFQKGPIQEVGINGITHESLLAVLIDRMEHFQNGPFPCAENATALNHLKCALEWLNIRTAKRAARGVEGQTKA